METQMLARDLRVDPRTGLEIVDVPYDYRTEFADLEGSLLHWFSKVRKIGQKGGRERAQERIFMVTDASIYLCVMGGGITRCAPVKDIEECIISKDNDLSFRLPPPEQYDMMLITSGQPDQEAILNILRRLFQFHTGKQLRVRKSEPSLLKQQLQLKKPPGWQLKIEPIKTKQLLLRQLREQEEEQAAETSIINDEFERIRGKLEQELERQVRQRNEEFAQFKREYRTLSEAHNALVMQYDAISADVETYVRLLNEKDAELELFRAGEHPRIKELEHEVEKLRMQHGMMEQQERAEFRNAIDQRDQSVQHLHEVRTLQDRRLDELQQRERALEWDLKEKSEEIVTLQNGIRDRDFLLQQKDREIESKEQRAAEKEREVRYTKSLMREAFKRQVEELEQIRAQFQQYDEQIVAYLERAFSDDSLPGPLPPRPSFEMRGASSFAESLPPTFAGTAGPPRRSLVNPGGAVPLP